MPLTIPARLVAIGGAFSRGGALIVMASALPLYVDDFWTIVQVRASVGTAPQGASAIVDVLKNGTTIFTTTANRPTIAAGAKTAVSGTPDIQSLVSGDYLTVSIIQVGSTVSGFDLTVNVSGR